MAARDIMINYREARMATHKQIADQLDISPALLDLVECGHVTHPNIARRMQEYYELSESEYEELIPEIHRKSSPKYDPNMYKFDTKRDFTIINGKKVYSDDPYELYLAKYESTLCDRDSVSE